MAEPLPEVTIAHARHHAKTLAAIVCLSCSLISRSLLKSSPTNFYAAAVKDHLLYATVAVMDIMVLTTMACI